MYVPSLAPYLETCVVMSGTKKGLEWQCSNEHSHEELARMKCGVSRRKGTESSPELGPNIAMEFHDHTFCASDCALAKSAL